MEFFIKMIQSTALVSLFLIVISAFVGLAGVIIWRLLINSNVSVEERKNANVEPNAGDWLLAILKFIGIVLCYIAIAFIASFSHALQSLLCYKIGVRVEESFELFILGIFTIFIVGLGIYSVFRIIKISAKESAIERENK